MIKAILPKTIFGNYWLVIVVFLFTTLFQGVLAQWEPDGTIIRDIIGPIDDEIIIPDQYHGALVVWVDGRLGTPAIYGQKVDSAGYQLWEEGGSFIGLTTFSYSVHKATTDGEGGAIVAWENNLVEYSDIYAQRINRDGELTWGDTGIAVTNWYGYEWQVSIVSDNDGGAIIAWRGDDQGIGRIVVQHLDSLGNKLYGDGGLTLTNQVEEQDGPLLAFASDSAFICAWIDNRTTGLGQGIYAQKFDIDGNILWDPEGEAVAYGPSVRVSYLDRMHHIAKDLEGGFYCAWRNFYNYEYKIYMQHVDSMGQHSWDSGGIEISIGAHNGDPFLVGSLDNRVIVTWIAGLDDHILCDIIDMYGYRQWPGGYIILENAAVNFGITVSVEDEFEVVSYSLNMPRKRIQKMSFSGEFLFGEEGIGFGIPDAGVTSMSAVSDSLGGVIVLTKRHNAGPLRIHRVYRDGHVGGDTVIYVDDHVKPCEYELSLINYPNPFNKSTNVILGVPADEYVNLTLYDILGRKLKNIFEGKIDKNPVLLQVDFDGLSNVSSGLYFLVLRTESNSVTKQITYLK